MSAVTVCRTIEAPFERVWEVATDIAGSGQTLSGVERVEMLSEGDFGVGTRWRETRTMLGRQATEVMWVTDVDTGRSYTVEAQSHGARYLSTLTFTTTSPERTEVAHRFEAQPLSMATKVLTKLTGPLAARPVTKALQKDLDDLAAAAERP